MDARWIKRRNYKANVLLLTMKDDMLPFISIEFKPDIIKLG